MSKFKILAIWEQIQNKKNNNVDGEFRQKFLTSRGQRLRITAAKKNSSYWLAATGVIKRKLLWSQMLSIKHLQRLQVHSKCHIKFLQAVQPFSLTFIHDFLFLCHPHPFLSLVFRAISLYDAITPSSTSNKCSSSSSVELKISLGGSRLGR